MEIDDFLGRAPLNSRSEEAIFRRDHWNSFRHPGFWPEYRSFLELRRDPEGSGDDLFRSILARSLQHEGGISVRPLSEDPGGVTKSGISSRLLKRLKNNPRWEHLPDDVLFLNDRQISEIYHAEFYMPLRIPEIAGLVSKCPPLADLPDYLFDLGVMSGVRQAGVDLQGALNDLGGTQLDVDGIIGSRTLDRLHWSINDGQAGQMIAKLISRRETFLSSLPHAGANPGWIARTYDYFTTGSSSLISS
jgi:lysozyme family protein